MNKRQLKKRLKKNPPESFAARNIQDVREMTSILEEINKQ